MGALLLLSLLPMALVFGAFGGDDDDPEGERIEAEPETPVTGTEGDDTIIGTDGVDTVSGAGGDDNIYLGAGDDYNPDADYDFDAMVDELLAEEPSDVQEAFTREDLWGADGGPGDDYIDAGHGHDAVTGGPGDDTLRGNLGGDLLFDAAGSDELYGGYGDDVLVALDDTGTDAPDLLDGGADDDLLFGDDGDTMTGGSHDDHFSIFWDKGDAPVVITDFVAEEITQETTEETPSGTRTSTFTSSTYEHLTVQTDTWSTDQTFTIAQSGDDVNVAIDGEVVATLQGANVTFAARAVSLYDTASATSILPTVLQG